jgi:hypothetical protein
MSKVKSYGLKAYVSKAFGLDVGSRIKRTKCGEEEKEHIYEVKQLFPHCVLLEDIYDHTRICPYYSKLSLMLRGIE